MEIPTTITVRVVVDRDTIQTLEWAVERLIDHWHVSARNREVE